MPQLPQQNHFHFQSNSLLLSIRNNFSLNAKRRRVVDISGRIQTKFLDTVKFLETELQKEKKYLRTFVFYVYLWVGRGEEEFSIAAGERRQ